MEEGWSFCHVPELDTFTDQVTRTRFQVWSSGFSEVLSIQSHEVNPFAIGAYNPGNGRVGGNN